MDNDQLSTINYQLSIDVYGAYKDSGVEWLGDVPAHWEVKRIKDVTLVKRGASPRPIDDPVYFDEEGEYSWVRIADLTASERYLLNTKEKLSILGASLSVKRYPGNFILSIAGTVGKPIITKIKCCIHDGFVWFPTLKINPEFLYYIFSTGLPYQGLGKLGTQLNLNTETVGLISIPTPSASEIERIVQHLDTQTAQIDRQIDLFSQKATQYGKLKQSLINETVTRGLDKSVAMKDSGVEWIGEVPAHWEMKRIKDLSFLQSGSSIVSEQIEVESLYPVYGGNGLRGYFSEYTNNGDYILIGRQGALCGNINYASGKFWASEHAVVVYLNRSINMKWYGEMLKMMNLNQYSIAAAQPGLALDRVKRLLLPVPPLAEQQAIATYLDEKAAQIDRVVTMINSQIEKLRVLRKTLINDVVTGKIKVA